MPRPSGWSLAVLSTCVFFVICTEMLPVGLLPEISAGLGVSTAATGVLVSAYAVVVAVASVPVAAFVERWSRRWVIAALLAVYALSNLAFAVAPAYGLAVVARVLGGVAHAGFFAVVVAAAVSLVEPARAGRAIMIVMIGNSLSLVFGIPLGTALGTAVGWRWAFGLLSVVCVVLALAVVLVLGGREPHREPHRTSVLQGVRRPAVVVMAVVITLTALGHFTLYTYISPLLLHDGVARTDVSLVLFAYGCGGLLGLFLAGAVVTRRPEAALTADIVVMGLSLVLGATVGSTPGIVVVAIVWGAAFGAFPTLTQTVMLRAAGDATDAASALVNATTNVGIAGGAFLGSLLLGGFAVPALGWFAAALVAVALVVYLARLRTVSSKTATTSPH